MNRSVPGRPSESPDFSVVVPTLNEGPNIARAVERAWSLRPDGVVVADGGSDDGTPAAARAAGARVVESRRGRGAQLNAGVAAARGGFLLILHADTWLAATAGDQLRVAISDPRTVWGAFRQRIDAPGRRFRILEAGNAWRARRLGLPYGDQGVFVSREALDAAGGFPDSPFLEDVDLACRLRRRARPLLLPGPLMVSARRWRRHGVIGQTLRNWGLLAAWSAGVPPERLAGWYRPHREPPRLTGRRESRNRRGFIGAAWLPRDRGAD